MKNCCFKTIVLSVFFLGIIAFVTSGRVSSCEAQKKPLRFGATVSLEGKYAQTSLMVQNAFKLWVEQVNHRGGLLGRPVKLILYDDKSQQERVRTLYEKLITQDRVDFVLAPYGTPLTYVASEVSERHGYIMPSGNSAGERVWERGYQYVFGMYTLSKRYFIGFLDLIARNEFESVAIIFARSSFQITASQGAREWAERFGLKTVIYQSFDNPDTQFPGLLQQLRAKKIDALIFCAYPPECYQFIRLMEKAEYRPRAMAFTIAPALPDFYKQIGPFAEGIFTSSQWEANERLPFPGTKGFIKAFIQLSGKVPSYHAGGAYGVCQILEKAIIQTGSFDQQKIMDAIHSLDTVTVTGRFKIDHAGRQIGHSSIIIQWQQGKKEIVYPTQMMTAPPQFNQTKGNKIEN